ncbi:Cation efflux protein [Carpediemonas membranifera]|uniref:Cation efflux protein n=1 Tax=Carpediemonas membranifera TaxID=201153 RepID=A0A8J6E339_9EUKA|nr:Cation efflux protein [Carpediemonas membranifera]|eukprot:KAG9395111.1 Cation efflux protein [Carpediemonas membranifera]
MGHSHSHDHSHATVSDKPWFKDLNVYRCMTMVVLTGTFMLAEVMVGAICGSLALLADGFHMFSDLFALIIGLISIVISKKTRTPKYTFGFSRMDVVGGFFNAIMVIALIFSLVIECVERVLEPSAIEYPWLILSVAVAGLLVNILGLFIFHDHGHSHGHSHGHKHEEEEHEHEHEPQEMDAAAAPPSVELTKAEKKLLKKRAKGGHSQAVRGMFLHILGDFLGSIAAIVSGLTMTIFSGAWWTVYVDLTLTLLIIAILLRSAIPMLLKMMRILLQRVPGFVQLEALEAELKALDSVRAYHDLHVWQLAGEKVVGTVHVILTGEEPDTDIPERVKDIKRIFHKHGVHAVTIQPEFMLDIIDNSDAYCQLTLDCHYQAGMCCPGTMRPVHIGSGECHCNSPCKSMQRPLVQQETEEDDMEGLEPGDNAV